MLNVDRGRQLGGKPLTPDLSGTLRIRRDDAETPVCGGFGETGQCTGRGTCAQGDDGNGLGTCRCQGGWGGRFCDKSIEEKPQAVARPSPVPGAPPALAGSATMTVDSGAGRYFKWTVDAGNGKIAIRARVLLGTVVDGKGNLVKVGGGGAGVGVFARRGGAPGERPEDVARLHVEPRGDGERDTYEFVTVEEGGERQDWFVWLARNETIGDGEGKYSIRVGRCGADGLPDCPFNGEEEGKFPAGVVIGVCVVVGVLVVAIVIGLLVRKRCKGRRWGSTAGSQVGAAWAQVQVAGDGLVGNKASRYEMEEYRRRKEVRLKAAAEVSIDVDVEGSTTTSSPTSSPVR